MSIREDFEAWAIDADYSVHKNKLGLYTMQRTKRAWDAYQAATSRQEAKIKALRASLNWALEQIVEEPFEWTCCENGDAHRAAIELAREKS